jgi:hypothetical protein
MQSRGRLHSILVFRKLKYFGGVQNHKVIPQIPPNSGWDRVLSLSFFYYNLAYIA